MKNIIILLALFSITVFAQQRGSFIDPRDGKKYKTVKIGVQTWMAENLNYAAANSSCYVDNPANCKKYGRLYNWEDAMRVCPSDWHLPSDDEWEILVDYVGTNAGAKLKAKSGWNSYEGAGGTDAFGFAALPGGGGGYSGMFCYADNCGIWWSSTEDYVDGSNVAYRRGIHYHGADVRRDHNRQSNWFSVRCVKD